MDFEIKELQERYEILKIEHEKLLLRIDDQEDRNTRETQIVPGDR